MEIHTQPITAFARFFEATPAAKVRAVREARLFQSHPDDYMQRAFYAPLRNALRQTHWKGSDLATFSALLDDVVDAQKVKTRREHYRLLGDAYIKFWQVHDDAKVFEVPSVETEIGGLRLRIAGDFGISFGGDDYILEPYMRGPRPTRLFRQAVQYLTERAREHVWNPNWQAAIYDVRRGTILQPLRFRPADLRVGLQGAAADFQAQWRELDQISTRMLDTP